jgi:hypothetical protein
MQATPSLNAANVNITSNKNNPMTHSIAPTPQTCGPNPLPISHSNVAQTQAPDANLFNPSPATTLFSQRTVILPTLFQLQPVLFISMLMISTSISILVKPTQWTLPPPSNLNQHITASNQLSMLQAITKVHSFPFHDLQLSVSREEAGCSILVSLCSY